MKQIIKLLQFSSYLFPLLVYYLIKKPFWSIIYNTKGNKFSCKAKMIKCQIYNHGKNNRIEIGTGWIYKTKIHIYGDGNEIILRNDSRIRDGAFIRVGATGNKIIIGENFECSYALITAGDNASIYIGDNCLFSNKIVVRSNDGHEIIDEKTGQKINPGADVVIGNHVWIGYGVSILKGSTIGNNSIIGTNSMVLGANIPSGSIAVGTPAKIVKSGVNWRK